jgi:hypothetical protein
VRIADSRAENVQAFCNVRKQADVLSRQNDAPMVSLEKRHPKVAFKITNLAADSRLGNQKLIGRPAETQESPRAFEGTQGC